MEALTTTGTWLDASATGNEMRPQRYETRRTSLHHTNSTLLTSSLLEI